MSGDYDHDLTCEETVPAPRGPGKCPTEGCDKLEDGNCPTGQCLACVERICAADGPPAMTRSNRGTSSAIGDVVELASVKGPGPFACSPLPVLPIERARNPSKPVPISL